MRVAMIFFTLSVMAAGLIVGIVGACLAIRTMEEDEKKNEENNQQHKKDS